jgi:hypothetical protein
VQFSAVLLKGLQGSLQSAEERHRPVGERHQAAGGRYPLHLLHSAQHDSVASGIPAAAPEDLGT